MIFNRIRYHLPVLLLICLSSTSHALDLVPRQWNHLPLGTNFAGVGYIYSQADISVDPVLQLEDVEMEMQSIGGTYIRTFEVFDRSARIDLTQAYQFGEWTGNLRGQPASTSRTGFADTLVRLAVNLYGAPPLSGKDFFKYRSEIDRETIIGLGLVTRLPTGRYLEDKLINLGQNRFVFRPQLGITHMRGKWTAELTTEMAFYTENDEFFSGNTLEQDPIFIIHGHLIHTFRPGLWIGAGLGYDYGGESSINGIDKNNTAQDIGWAFSIGYPIDRNSGIKIEYIGIRTQEAVGADSDFLKASLSISW